MQVSVEDYVKLYDDIDIDKHIIPMSEKYNNGNMEKLTSVGLCIPCEAENSASRKAMHASQFQQKVCLEDPDYPYLSTGYENKFGERSSAFNQADRDWTVIGRVDKYSNRPGYHYFLFVIDEQGNMDVIERVSLNHNTENYGYKFNNDYIDKLMPGSVIKKGDVIKKSTSFDNANNYMMGKNLNVAYIADSHTTEDAIEISRSASYKLARPEIKKITILINDNDIPLNLYGDENVYKIIPDIGEVIKKGIICGTRTTRNDEMFFTQSGENLKRPMINDITFKTKGTVTDIDIYCNKSIATSPNSMYEGQLEFYENDTRRFAEEVVALLKNYIDNSMYKKSAQLSEMYTKCEMLINGAKYFKDNEFSNIIIELTVYLKSPLEVGDKVTSRYGGKGVISKVIDDELMPRVSGTDEIVELIWNQSTCVNRLNPGQLFEHSSNFISKNLCQFILTIPQDVEICINIMNTFYKHFSDEWAKFVEEEIENCVNDDEVLFCISDWITEDFDGLYIVTKPISEQITLDTLFELYADFPFIKPVFLDVPITGSRGKVRFVQSKKPSIVAKQYIYRMKQNAEEKHSATSMSATNVRCLNSKSKASKMFMRVHSNTPIRFGEMENSILMLMGAEVQIRNLMIYSTSPQARRDARQMLDSYEFNVQLSEDGKSRSAEILNAIIKCMGHKFEFRKIPIKYKESCQPFKETLFQFFDWNNDPLFRPGQLMEEQLFVPFSDEKLFPSMGPGDDPRLFIQKGKEMS